MLLVYTRIHLTPLDVQCASIKSTHFAFICIQVYSMVFKLTHACQIVFFCLSHSYIKHNPPHSFNQFISKMFQRFQTPDNLLCIASCKSGILSKFLKPLFGTNVKSVWIVVNTNKSQQQQHRFHFGLFFFPVAMKSQQST